jgi:carboxylate-amine ligase
MAPGWARWNPAVVDAPWTLGLEEEVMLLEPASLAPAWRAEELLTRLPDELARHTRAETHGCALELATAPHATVAAAVRELADLRAGLAEAARGTGLEVAAAGMHPVAGAEETQVSPGARYQYLHASLRELARGIPTFGLHVHVAVPSPALAIRALDRMRAHVPVLLGLSANSPFRDGRDSGFASGRTPVFQSFPRSGLPRAFGDYDAYVEAIDVLVRSGAIPEPTFIWWDARLQPALGTLELRVMDAQTRVADTAALAALVQCLVRLEALDGVAEPELVRAPEALDENRFLAARDGVAAELVDPRAGARVPLTDRLRDLVHACWPHAEALGCVPQLELVERLVRDPSAARQRAQAGREGGLGGLVGALACQFSPTPRPPAALSAAA